MVLNKTACFLQQTKLRDGSRTSVTSKMELFVIIVNGFQPLTIYHKVLYLECRSSPRHASWYYHAYEWTFEELLEKDESFTIYHYNIQMTCIE